jgi:hypothetical protein
MPSMHSSISGSVTNANIACYVRMVRMAQLQQRLHTLADTSNDCHAGS